MLTSYRIIQDKREIFYNNIDDIIVMNQRRLSQSQYLGTYFGRYTRIGLGNSKSSSISVGDVVFTYRGSPCIIFKEIADPHGVTRLAKSARKSFINAFNSLQKTIAIQTKADTTIKSKVKENILWKPLTQSIRIPDLNWQLDNSIIPLASIKRYEYETETLDGIEANKKYNRIVIHPIEAGCSIEFAKEGDVYYSGSILEIKDLREYK